MNKSTKQTLSIFLILVIVLVVGGLLIQLLKTPGNNLNDLNLNLNQNSENTTENVIGLESQRDLGGVNYEISMKENRFLPNKIVGEPGELLRIRLVNIDSKYNFVADELAVRSSVLSTGESEVLEIKIPESAEFGKIYEFYSDLDNHREKGMSGTIEVI